MNRRPLPSRRPWAAGLLRLDGLFLLVVGTAQAVLDLAGYFGSGPQAVHFDGQPYVIGFYEAHALAALIGVALIAASSRSHNVDWHAWAAAIHLVLATANVTFWESFEIYELTAAGYVATFAHAGFVLLQTLAWMQARSAR